MTHSSTLGILLSKAHTKVEHRPSNDDSNYNYVHIENVLDLIKEAYAAGKTERIQDEVKNNTIQG